MTFTLRWTEGAAATYAELRAAAQASKHGKRRKSTKQQGLFKQVHKCVSLLPANPRHPGLQTHEYHSIENPFDANQKVFEAYAQNRTPGAYRVFWCYGPGAGEITIIAITPHP
jgi:hypothetical protein